MSICATAAALAAPNLTAAAKLVLILISDAIDVDGLFETRFLDAVRADANLTPQQLAAVLAELRAGGYYTTGHVSELGQESYLFTKLLEG